MEVRKTIRNEQTDQYLSHTAGLFERAQIYDRLVASLG
jgi:hypothetical protein